jgi:hypothetical protein
MGIVLSLAVAPVYPVKVKMPPPAPTDLDVRQFVSAPHEKNGPAPGFDNANMLL